MDHQNLPLLQSLKSILTDLDAGSEDLSVKGQLGLAKQLVGHLLVGELTLPSLRKEVLKAWAALIPDIEKVFAEHYVSESYKKEIESGAFEAIVSEVAGAASNGVSQAMHIGELKAMCNTLDLSRFDACERLVSEISQALNEVGSDDAGAAVRELVRIEAGYRAGISTAITEEVTPSAKGESQTVSATKTKTYDKDALAEFINTQFDDEQNVTIAESNFISGGYSKYTVGIRLAGNTRLPENVVLRGDGGDMYGGASVVDEYKVLKLMFDQGVCVPEPLILEETGDVFGAPFLLTEKRTGSVIGHMYNLPDVNREICMDTAAKLADIHKVPIDALAGVVDGVDAKNSEKLSQWLDEAYDNWKPLGLPSSAFTAAFHYLRENLFINDLPTAPRGLVHGDYGLNNLLIENDRVNAILDWEFAHVGNTAYDLGYFYFMAEALGSWELFLESYEKAGGGVPAKEQLDYHRLMAATRLSTMLCQTVATYSTGNASNMSVAGVVAYNFYDETISRLAGILERIA